MQQKSNIYTVICTRSTNFVHKGLPHLQIGKTLPQFSTIGITTSRFLAVTTAHWIGY